MSEVRLNPRLRREISRIITFHTFGDEPQGGMTAELLHSGVRGCWAAGCTWQGNLLAHDDHIIDLITQTLGVGLINALVGDARQCTPSRTGAEQLAKGGL